MPDDHGGTRRIVLTMPGTTETETAQRDESAGVPLADVERVEDTVPYLPPLASHRIRARWGEVRQGAPTVYPEDAAKLDEPDE
jgi:hypothetical protein